MERRRARLELAKRLCTLCAGLAGATGAGSRGRSSGDRPAGRAAGRRGALPRSAAGLARGGAGGQRRLGGQRVQALVSDEAAPLAASRPCCAGAGGDRARRQEPRAGESAPGSLPASGWLRRAYNWGRRHGVPSDPPLTLALLAAQGGDGLALRYAQTLKSASPFRLAPDLLRELLARDVPAELVVALAEAAAAAGPLARRILAQRPTSPARPGAGAASWSSWRLPSGASLSLAWRKGWRSMSALPPGQRSCPCLCALSGPCSILAL